jgi:hypothetical protein
MSNTQLAAPLSDAFRDSMVLWRRSPYHPVLPISALEVLCPRIHLSPHFKSWHPHRSFSTASQHHRSSRAFPALPPHNPDHLSLNAGTRRLRTPSMDRLYNAAQPPPKRSRANTDTNERRPREPRPSYSASVCLHFSSR